MYEIETFVCIITLNVFNFTTPRAQRPFGKLTRNQSQLVRILNGEEDMRRILTSRV